MAYRQSLMKYAGKYGVSRARRKYNKSRSYIYCWWACWNGNIEYQSRCPHSHPNCGAEADPGQRRRNPQIGLVELWHRLKQLGYTRRPESLFRVMRKLGMFPQEKKKKAYTPKPYQQITHPGERIQVDVKVAPRRCIADPELLLFQYTAIDAFSRLRFLAAYPEQSTCSSADFLKRLVKWYARRGIRVECVQTDNDFKFTNCFSNSKRDIPTLFEKTAAGLGIRHKLIRPHTPRHNSKLERSHCKDNEEFYASNKFFSFHNLQKQLTVRQRQYNTFPMRPLNWCSTNQVLFAFPFCIILH